VHHLLLHCQVGSTFGGGPELVRNTVGFAKNNKGGNVSLGFQKKERKTQGMGCSFTSNEAING